jgi:hypothetical protein
LIDRTWMQARQSLRDGFPSRFIYDLRSRQSSPQTYDLSVDIGGPLPNHWKNTSQIFFGQPRVAQVGVPRRSKHISANHGRITKLRRIDQRTLKPRMVERCALEVRAPEIRTFKFRTVERRTLQLGISQRRALKLRSVEPRALHGRVVESGPPQQRADEARAL